MEKMRLNIGVDVSKDKIDCCLLGDNFKKSNFVIFSNNKDGFVEFLEWLPNGDYSFFVGFESTANYMRNFQKFLSDNGINSVLLNARTVKHYSNFMNMQGKNDQKDSYMLASLVSTLQTSSFTLDYSDSKEQLSKMISALDHLIEQRKRTKTFFKSLDFGSYDLSSHFTYLEALDKSIDDLEKVVKKKLYEVYPVARQIEKEVVGVGQKLLASLVPLIYDSVGVYSREQITAFIGLNPVENKSGYFVGRDKLNRFGNKQIKKILFMSALSSSRSNLILQSKFNELVLLGHNKKKVLGVLMRKILLVIHSYIKKDKINRGLLMVHTSAGNSVVCTTNKPHATTSP